MCSKKGKLHNIISIKIPALNTINVHVTFLRSNTCLRMLQTCRLDANILCSLDDFTLCSCLSWFVSSSLLSKLGAEQNFSVNSDVAFTPPSEFGDGRDNCLSTDGTLWKYNKFIYMVGVMCSVIIHALKTEIASKAQSFISHNKYFMQ